MTIDPDQRLNEAAKQLKLAREELGGEAARRLRDAEATVRGVRRDPREVRCDGGDGLAEHLTTVSSLAGDDYVRCTTCGREAVTRDELDHHEDCPERGETLVPDGGAIACDECGEELSPAEGVCLPAGRFCDDCKPEALKTEGRR